MTLLDIFKSKSKNIEEPVRRKLEVPAAPPSKEELPTFPTPDEVPGIKKEEKLPKLSEMPKGQTHLERTEKYAVEKTEDELAQRDDLRLKKPIFVDLENYRELMKEMTIIGSTLKEGADSLARVADFKEDENKEFKKWEASLKDIQRKLIYADKTLFAATK